MAEKNLIEVETRLGRQRIGLDRVIRFPQGLIGYEDKRDFALLQIKPGVPFLVLQSLEDPSLGLMVADPYSFMQNFKVSLNDAEQHMLNAERAEQLSVLVTVTIPAGKPNETCLNLCGPIVVNHVARIGLQLAQADPSHSGKWYLNKENGAEAAVCGSGPH